jgi:hypothetical protein
MFPPKGAPEKPDEEKGSLTFKKLVFGIELSGLPKPAIILLLYHVSHLRPA